MGDLQVDDLTFTYRGSNRPAVAGLSASLSGASIAVLGPNGAGKTTLFEILSTVRRPQRGSFAFNGAPTETAKQRNEYRKHIGVMPQHMRAFAGYTSADFLRYVCWLREVPRGRAEAWVSEALQVVNLESERDRKIKTLSGGMRQRLGLAQAVVARPGLILLDEPTVGLDPAQRVGLRTYLGSLANRCTILFATHLVDDVAALADQVLVVAQGQGIFQGSPAELCLKPEGSTVTGAEVEAAYLHRVPSDE